MRRRLFPLAVVVLVLSCAREMPPEPNVFAILSTDSPVVCVQVGEMLEVGDTFPVIHHIDTIWYGDTFYLDFHYTLPWFGVSDAQVRLKRGEENFVLEEMHDSAGYYHTDSLVLAPGEKWELEVDYSDERHVQARTQIPGSFEIISPLTDTLQLENTLWWTSSKNATGYAVSWFYWASYEHEDSIVYRSGLYYGGCRSAEIRYLPLDYYFAYYDSIEFYIAALDSNYYEYRKGNYRTLEGAWEVFGAQTVVSRRYYLPPPDTFYPPIVDKD